MSAMPPYGSESSGHDDASAEWIREDLDELQRHLEKADELLQELDQRSGRVDFGWPEISGHEDPASTLGRVRRLVNRITSVVSDAARARRGSRPKAETLLPLVSFGEEAQTLVAGLHQAVTNGVAAVTSAFTSALASLEKAMKAVVAKLWGIISGLAKPKQWKLSGEVGTGVLGLTSVRVEITFGP